MLHLLLHVLVPAAVGGLFFRRDWPWAFGIMLATMVVDLDHLLADPIYDPGRCSIGFHPAHQPLLFPAYGVLCFFPRRIRYAGLGLLIHMLLDGIDCRFTNGIWMV